MTTTPNAPNARTTATPSTSGTWSGGRTALVVVGGVVAVLGAGNLVAGGAVALWSDQQRDGNDYYTAGPATLSTDTYALVTPDLDVNANGPDVFYGQDLLGDLRLEATSAETPLFLGIGPSDDVAAYLDGVAHDEIDDVEVDPFAVSLTAREGGEPPSTPTAQDFWVASDSGAGARTLEWDVADGDWSVVVMNADASAGIDAEVSAGATLPFITPVAIITLVVGGLLLVIGLTLVIVAFATRPRTTG